VTHVCPAGRWGGIERHWSAIQGGTLQYLMCRSVLLNQSGLSSECQIIRDYVDGTEAPMRVFSFFQSALSTWQWRLFWCSRKKDPNLHVWYCCMYDIAGGGGKGQGHLSNVSLALSVSVRLKMKDTRSTVWGYPHTFQIQLSSILFPFYQPLTTVHVLPTYPCIKVPL
jgi:hypothetical protein